VIVTEKTTRGATKNTLIWISYLLTVTKPKQETTKPKQETTK